MLLLDGKQTRRKGPKTTLWGCKLPDKNRGHSIPLYIVQKDSLGLQRDLQSARSEGCTFQELGLAAPEQNARECCTLHVSGRFLTG